MEIINIVIFIVVSSYIFVNPRRAIIFMTVWFLALSMFIIPPPLPNLNFIFGLCLIAYTILYVKEGFNLKNTEKYPFWIPLVLYIISSATTLIFAPFMLGLYAEIQDIFTNFVFPFVLWCTIKNESDIKQIISLFITYAVILILYGFYEALTNTNPYIEFLINNGLVNESVGLSDRMRFGFRRIQSILTYNNALCVNCSLWVIIIISYKKIFPLYYNQNKNILLIISIGLIVLTLLTGTRSGILGMCIALLSLINIKQLLHSQNLVILIIAILVILIFSHTSTFFSELTASFTDTSSVEGSDTDMRERQFAIASYWMAQSFLTGNGIGFTFGYVKHIENGLAGAESVWIPLMIEKGLLGIIAYISIVLFVIIYGIRKSNFYIVFATLSFITVKTLSSVPGVEIAYFLIPVVILAKMNIIKSRKNGIVIS